MDDHVKQTVKEGLEKAVGNYYKTGYGQLLVLFRTTDNNLGVFTTSYSGTLTKPKVVAIARKIAPTHNFLSVVQYATIQKNVVKIGSKPLYRLMKNMNSFRLVRDRI